MAQMGALGETTILVMLQIKKFKPSLWQRCVRSKYLRKILKKRICVFLFPVNLRKLRSFLIVQALIRHSNRLDFLNSREKILE